MVVTGTILLVIRTWVNGTSSFCYCSDSAHRSQAEVQKAYSGSTLDQYTGQKCIPKVIHMQQCNSSYININVHPCRDQASNTSWPQTCLSNKRHSSWKLGPFGRTSSLGCSLTSLSGYFTSLMQSQILVIVTLSQEKFYQELNMCVQFASFFWLHNPKRCLCLVAQILLCNLSHSGSVTENKTMLCSNKETNMYVAAKQLYVGVSY